MSVRRRATGDAGRRMYGRWLATQLVVGLLLGMVSVADAPTASATACPSLAVETPTGSGVCVWGLTGTASIPSAIPAGVTSLEVILVGGGGGGGGGYSKAGSGGGGGAVRSFTVSVATGQVLSPTIGSGGAGGTVTSSGANGSAGTDTSLTINSVTQPLAQGGTAGLGTGGSASGRRGGGSSGRTVGGSTSSSYSGGYWSSTPGENSGAGGAGAAASGGDATSIAGAGGLSVSVTSGLWATAGPALTGAVAMPFGGGGGGGGLQSTAGSSAIAGGLGGTGAGNGGAGNFAAPGAGVSGTNPGGGGGGGSAKSLGGAAGGRGSDGAILIAFTYTPPATPPDAPTGLVATDGDGQSSIAFTAGSSNGAAVTNYKFSTDGGTSWQAFSSAVTSSPVVIASLTNGATYQVKLRAVNSAGDGAASAAVSVTPVSSAPPPTPVTPSTPTTSAPEPVVAVSVTPAPVRRNLDPVPPGTTASIPGTGLSPGQGVVLLDGVVEPVTMRPHAVGDGPGVELVGASFTMSVGVSARPGAGAGESGAPRAGGSTDLDFTSGGSAIIRGTGYEPNSELRFYMFSTATDLGAITSDGEGAVRGDIAVPAGLPLGPHTFQIVGYAPDGLVRVVSLGVTVSGAPVATPRTQVATVTIVFAAMSSQLTKHARESLRKLVRGPGRAVVSTIVVGYVQDSGAASNNRSLARARARSVATHLRYLGLRGMIEQRASAVRGLSSSQGRTEVVNVRFTVRVGTSTTQGVGVKDGRHVSAGPVAKSAM